MLQVKSVDVKKKTRQLRRRREQSLPPVLCGAVPPTRGGSQDLSSLGEVVNMCQGQRLLFEQLL